MAMIMDFPYALGWQGREQRFNKMNELYGKKESDYALFVYEETREFEEAYEHLNTIEKKVYVAEGSLKDLMEDLRLWDFHENKLVTNRNGKLLLQLKEFPKDDFIRQPKVRFLEGYFYLISKEEYEKIPFENNPITKKRDIFLARKLPDSVTLTENLQGYFDAHLEAIHTNKSKTSAMKYHVIVKERVERYVPKNENAKALALAEKHGLTNLEFNLLNYFYETGKSLRNDVGQLYYDPKHRGIGWGGSRKWVKKQMERLINLGLVKFEHRYDCRDGRYTSWYFYDSSKSLDDLKHDF